MYWHQAHHIHGWFVENVQHGKDDCHEYLVAWGDIRDLIWACRRVLDTVSVTTDGSLRNTQVAARLFPLLTTSPSDAEYDTGFLVHVSRTYAWAQRMLEDKERGVPGDIYYLTAR